MVSFMRVAGALSMQTEVHFHLSKVEKGICFEDPTPLKELLRLVKNKKVCDEIVKIGGLTSLINTMTVNYGGMRLREIDHERRNVTRMLLGKLIFNNEDIDWIRLLIAIIKEIRYKKLVILKADSPTPTSIDRTTIILQQNGRQIKAYWSVINFNSRSTTVQEAFVSENIFNMLLPFMSLTQLEDQDVIQKVVQSCECSYEPHLQVRAIAALELGCFANETKNVVREVGGIPVIVSFLFNHTGRSGRVITATLDYLLEKNALNQKEFISICSKLLSKNRRWTIRVLARISYGNEPIQRAIIEAGLLSLLGEEKQLSKSPDNEDEYHLVSCCQELIQQDIEQEKKKLQCLQRQKSQKKSQKKEEYLVTEEQLANKKIVLSTSKVTALAQKESVDTTGPSVTSLKSKVAIENALNPTQFFSRTPIEKISRSYKSFHYPPYDYSGDTLNDKPDGIGAARFSWLDADAYEYGQWSNGDRHGVILKHHPLSLNHSRFTVYLYKNGKEMSYIEFQSLNSDGTPNASGYYWDKVHQEISKLPNSYEDSQVYFDTQKSYLQEQQNIINYNVEKEKKKVQEQQDAAERKQKNEEERKYGKPPTFWSGDCEDALNWKFNHPTHPLADESSSQVCSIT